jgi:hypothetical protein
LTPKSLATRSIAAPVGMLRATPWNRMQYTIGCDAIEHQVSSQSNNKDKWIPFTIKYAATRADNRGEFTAAPSDRL